MAPRRTERPERNLSSKKRGGQPAKYSLRQARSENLLPAGRHGGWRLLSDRPTRLKLLAWRLQARIRALMPGCKIKHLWIVAAPSGGGNSDLISDLLHHGTSKGLETLIRRRKRWRKVGLVQSYDFQSSWFRPQFSREVFLHLDLREMALSDQTNLQHVKGFVAASQRVTLIMIDPPIKSLRATYIERLGSLTLQAREHSDTVTRSSLMAPEQPVAPVPTWISLRIAYFTQLLAELDEPDELAKRLMAIGERIHSLAPTARKFTVTHTTPHADETLFGRHL